MHHLTDLSLLRDELSQLSRTPYFNRTLDDHTKVLIDVIEHVLDASPKYDGEIIQGFAEKVWMTLRYLQGSTTKESPYEIEYCLRLALRDWLDVECVVTTALTDEKVFDLKFRDPWEYVRNTLDRYTGRLPDSRLVFISVPRLYKSMPLFCCALYHELGHFIDLVAEITHTTLLLKPLPDEMSDNAKATVEIWRMEHFADLFAACYVGSAIAHNLEALELPDIALPSHPQPTKRLDLIKAFLEGEPLEDVDMFQDALKGRGLPALHRRFDVPQIEPAFDDIRPHVIEDDRQLHGLFPAGWSYMAKALHGDGPIWARGADRLEIIRMVNDLAEKTIRNAAIRRKWSEAA